MFERNDKPDERAQVGIGTLIVFIAMVLVAAIAAGVLINTAGFLQTSAEESGQQAGDQVTNRLQVVSTIGSNITDGVGTVEVTVKQAPGAGNIDIGETLAQWVDSTGSYDLTEGSGFEVYAVQDPNDESIETSSVLNDPGDRAKLLFDATDSTNNRGDELSEGTTTTITLNTQSGGTTTVAISVPETLSDSTAVNL